MESVGNAADLTEFTKSHAFPLNRQATFRQGSDGAVDQIDISRSPRGSLILPPDMALITQQRRRSSLVGAVTPEQTEDRDHFDDGASPPAANDNDDKHNEEYEDDYEEFSEAEVEVSQEKISALIDITNDDEEEEEEEDTFGLVPGPMTVTPSTKRSFPVSGHNRKGTFVQSSTGKGVVFDMSSTALISPSEVLNSDEAQLTTFVEGGTDDNASSEDDGGNWRASLSPRKHSFLNSNETFAQAETETMASMAVAVVANRNEDERLSTADDRSSSTEVRGALFKVVILSSLIGTSAVEFIGVARAGSLNHNGGVIGVVVVQ